MLKKTAYIAPALFLAAALLLSPWIYNFPLNDDWAYALGVKHFLERGRFVFCDWASATQVLHIFSGVLCSKIFGFSFAALRVQNIIFAAAGVFVFSKLLDEFEIAPFEKFLAAGALALNPLYLTLACSFMTDIPYFLFMLLSVCFGVVHLKTGRERALYGLAFFSAAAFLIRQLAIAVPLAFSATLFFEGRLKISNLVKTWALPAAAMGGYLLWFRYVHGPTWASENYVMLSTLKHIANPAVFAADSLYRIFSVMMEAGLLLLPLAAGYCFFRSGRESGPEKGKARKERHGAADTGKARFFTAGFWLALLAFGIFAAFNGALPYLENTIGRSGFGTLTLAGASVKMSGIFLNRFFWLALTALAAAAAALLMRASGTCLREGSPALRFVFICALFHLAISLAGAKFFDRYLLPLLPWFALSAVVAARGGKFSKPAAAVTLALAALLSWAGVKDYLAWNKAKWELASKPRTSLKPEEIANGFDYEAWLTYDKNMAYLKSMKPLKMIGEWEWQQINNYKAMVSFAQDPRFEAIDTIEYRTPLSTKKGTLYLLKFPSP